MRPCPSNAPSPGVVLRLATFFIALLVAGCSSDDSSATAFGAQPSMDFERPLLPSTGGPATPVARKVSNVTDLTASAPSPPPTGGTPRTLVPPLLRGPSTPSLRSTAPPPTAPADILRPEVRKTRVGGISFTLLSFDDRNCDITIADKDSGLNTEWQTAAVAGSAHNAIAAINGGFFTPEGKPLGLVIENGKVFGAWNDSSSAKDIGCSEVKQSATSSRCHFCKCVLECFGTKQSPW